MRYLGAVATLEYESEKCAGCTLCADVCPHGVFEMAGKKARVTDKDMCMECGACMRNCAPGAIHVKTGVGCASALIRGMMTGEVSCGCSEGKEENCC